MKLSKYEIKENLMYLVSWGVVFLIPLITTYIRTVSNDTSSFRWDDVFHVWGVFLVYLVVFLVHNFFLAPMLIKRHKKLLYAISVLVLLSVFTLYQCTQRTGPMGGPPEVQLGMGPGFNGDQGPMGPPPNGMERDGDRFGPPPMPDDMNDTLEAQQGQMSKDERGLAMRDIHRPRMMLALNGIFSLIIVMLTLGMNLGVKLYFKSDEDAKEMKELERRSLEQQLTYLKYQINPHFFMNTLNNIHALVDIDPAKAKDTILELSKMMRYLLYEGDKSLIPLQREVDFLKNYINLMSLRYTDKVKITMDAPEKMPEASIPPLLLITFVENSFKHGVSYKRDSFIDIKISLDNDRLKFICRNSKQEDSNKEDKQGGVGLANIQQRLELLYGDNFTLDLDNGENVYEVFLLLPLNKLA